MNKALWLSAISQLAEEGLGRRSRRTDKIHRADKQLAMNDKSPPHDRSGGDFQSTVALPSLV